MIFFFLEFGALSLLCFTNERRTNFKKKSHVLTVLLNVQSHVVKVQSFFFFFFKKKGNYIFPRELPAFVNMLL
jgi:hypothetical protein